MFSNFAGEQSGVYLRCERFGVHHADRFLDATGRFGKTVQYESSFVKECKFHATITYLSYIYFLSSLVLYIYLSIYILYLFITCCSSLSVFFGFFFSFAVCLFDRLLIPLGALWCFTVLVSVLRKAQAIRLLVRIKQFWRFFSFF